MSRVVHFEIQADDPERAVRFYASVFGWEIKKLAGVEFDYWFIATAPGSEVTGGLQRRPAKTPPTQHGTNAYVCTVQVDDFDATADKILGAGGQVALPKFAIALPEPAWWGYFIDLEGNTFGVRQLDPNAS